MTAALAGRRAAAELQDLFTCVDLANDEGEPGMGLHVGTALWWWHFTNAPGHDVTQTTGQRRGYLSESLRMLTTSYKLLRRKAFAAILKSQHPSVS